MTRPRSRRPPTRPKSTSSSSSAINRLSVFDFSAEDELLEKADSENLKKFGKPVMSKKKGKKRKQREVSPVDKYTFLEFFSQKTRASQKETATKPIDVDAEGIQEVIDVDAQQSKRRASEDVLNKEVPGRDKELFSGSSNNGDEPVDIIPDIEKDGIKLNSSWTSISTVYKIEEERAPSYDSGGHKIDTLNKKVAVFPDFVLCGGKHYKGSQLIFSTKNVELKGSILNEPMRDINFYWAIGDIISIESTWCERVETAIVKLRFKLEDSEGAGNPAGRLGNKELMFAVYDPHWFERQEAIKSLGVYKDIWRVIFDIDAEEAEDSILRFSGVFLSKDHHKNSSFQETFEVVYPEGKPEAVTVSKRDVELLQPEAFINDNIIDFYIQYLKSKIQPEQQHRFYFFNCFFFKKLIGLDNNPSTVGQGKEAFQRVQKWTKDVNLFEKDYIFVPVNYSLHWSLIVICHPEEIANLRDDKVQKLPKVPCILHMDSIRGSHRGLRNTFQSYLCELWKEMQDTTGEYVSSKFLQLPFVSLEVPQQENSFDCGLFLLHYIELFLKESPDNFNPYVETENSKFLKRNWFLPKEASLKRAHILKLVFDIHETNSQRASADCSCRHPSPSQLENTNKQETEVKILEKGGISSTTCYGISSLDTEHKNDALVLADSLSKEACSDGHLKGKEADESGDQAGESTTDAEDCQLVADLPRYMSRGVKGKETQHNRRLLKNFNKHDKGRHCSAMPPDGFDRADCLLRRSDQIKHLKGMERMDSSMESLNIADCVVKDSSDEDCTLEPAACIIEDSQDDDGTNEDIPDCVVKDSYDENRTLEPAACIIEDSQDDDGTSEDIPDCVVKDSYDENCTLEPAACIIEDSQDDDGTSEDIPDCVVKDSHDEDGTRDGITACVIEDSQDDGGMDDDTADCIIKNSHDEDCIHDGIAACGVKDSQDEDGMHNETKRSLSLFRGSGTPLQEAVSCEFIDLTDDSTHKEQR